MEVKNTTEAPQLKFNWKHISLVVLHLVVFILSAFSHEFIAKEVTVGALPQILFYYLKL